MRITTCLLIAILASGCDMPKTAEYTAVKDNADLIHNIQITTIHNDSLIQILETREPAHPKLNTVRIVYKTIRTHNALISVIKDQAVEASESSTDKKGVEMIMTSNANQDKLINNAKQTLRVVTSHLPDLGLTPSGEDIISPSEEMSYQNLALHDVGISLNQSILTNEKTMASILEHTLKEKEE